MSYDEIVAITFSDGPLADAFMLGMGVCVSVVIFVEVIPQFCSLIIALLRRLFKLAESKGGEKDA